MLKAVLAIVVGYVVLAVIVIAGLAGLMLLLGIDRVYEPGTYDVSTMWIATNFGVGLIAAVAGGLVCVMIAKPRSKAPMGLAVIALLLGIAMAVPHFLAEEPETKPQRGEEVTMTEIMENTEPPTISAIGNPIIGFIGILIGARLGRKS